MSVMHGLMEAEPNPPESIVDDVAAASRLGRYGLRPVVIKDDEDVPQEYSYYVHYFR